MFILGILILLAGTFLAGVAFSGASLILFRAIQGIGGAMIFATGVALLVEVFPPNRRGEVLGINTAAVYLGLSLGPSAGGFLVQGLGWRSIFFVSLLPGLVSLWVLLHVQPSRKRLHQEKADPIEKTVKGSLFQLDTRGTVLYTSSILSLILGFTHLITLWGVSLFLLGCILLIGFFWVEKREESPLFEVLLFYSNRVFAFSNLAALINYASTYAVAYLLSLYLQYLKGFSPRKAGFILIMQPLLQALCTPFAGKGSDRIRPGLLASIGMSSTVVGLILCIRLDSSTSVVWVLGSLSLLGLGFGLFSSPNSNAIMGSVDRKNYSVASATLATMRLLGQMLSMGITLLVFFSTVGGRSHHSGGVSKVSPWTTDSVWDFLWPESSRYVRFPRSGKVT